MAKQRAVQVVAIVASLLAALICQKLLLKHVTGSSGSSWFEAGCTAGAEGETAGCAAVLASPYSYIPPKHADSPPGRPHLPVAFVGLVYYSALLLWFIGVGRPSPSRRLIHALPTLLVALGLLGSVYYTTIMLARLQDWCPWCLLTHALNVVIAITILLMWPGLTRTSGEMGSAPRAEPAMAIAAHPSIRLVIITLIAIAVAAYGELNMLGRKIWEHQAAVRAKDLDRCMDVVDRFKADTAALVRNWQLAPRCDVAVTPDDPVREPAPPGQPTFDVVVFSDFQCPMCRRFASFLEEKVAPLVAGRLRFAFRHYPLDKSCNPMVSSSMHPKACMAARAAEAARILDGGNSFLQAHDLLFERADEIKTGALPPETIADELGLDATAFVEAMQRPEADQRIVADAEQAKMCRIRGTPSVFVEGRMVDVLAVMEIRFWDKLADLYWKKTGQPRPPATRLAE